MNASLPTEVQYLLLVDASIDKPAEGEMPVPTASLGEQPAALLPQGGTEGCGSDQGWFQWGWAEWGFRLQPIDGNFQPVGPPVQATDREVVSRGLTEQRLELLTLIRALESLEGPSTVTLARASGYLKHGLVSGLSRWRASGWQWECHGRVIGIANADLWQRLDRVLQFHTLRCRRLRFDRPHPDPNYPYTLPNPGTQRAVLPQSPRSERNSPQAQPARKDRFPHCRGSKHEAVAHQLSKTQPRQIPATDDPVSAEKLPASHLSAGRVAKRRLSGDRQVPRVSGSPSVASQQELRRGPQESLETESAPLDQWTAPFRKWWQLSREILQEAWRQA